MGAYEKFMTSRNTSKSFDKSPVAQELAASLVEYVLSYYLNSSYVEFTSSDFYFNLEVNSHEISTSFGNFGWIRFLNNYVNLDDHELHTLGTFLINKLIDSLSNQYSIPRGEFIVSGSQEKKDIGLGDHIVIVNHYTYSICRASRPPAKVAWF